MAPSSQELGSKERSLFAQVVKFYENKQHKKGLKAAEQILRKNPDHGDTLAMKALIQNSQGQSDEAFALSKIAIKNNMKSHVCWHVYGLLWRSVKNFDEAIRAYKFALKLAPESTQIQKDLALLQIQMRDYPGYIQSRRSMLQQKTMLRQNWTALAVAQHLAGDLNEAERTLTTYEDIIKKPPPKTDVEHHEAILYKNLVIAEMGETERALDHLEAATKINPDRGAVMELRAQYLLQLGRKSAAEKAYRELLDRNAENRVYYNGLISSKEVQAADHQTLKSIYDEYAEKNPRADAPRRIPLDFLEGKDFEKAADLYLQRMLRKGVPSTFANLKSLYESKAKQDTIEQLVLGYDKGKGASVVNGSAEGEDLFHPSVKYFLAQHFNYHSSRDLEKALKSIDEAIAADGKSVDYHMTKARILKHHGDTQAAAEMMEKARSLDERDRYINTKAAKYRLRNNDNESAINDMSKFTRNEAVGGPLGDLHDMQCQWFIYEDGCAHLRKGDLGLALKRFTTIINIFEIWHEDQFDFHSFSLRKGQVRAYVDMIRWEDHLREHPFFTRAAIQAALLYVRLYDNPDLAHGQLANGLGSGKMTAAERKKAQKKARKEAESKAQKEAELKDAKKTAGVDQNGDAKKEDQDPKGEKLLQTSEPLVEAMKIIDPLLEFSPKDLHAQQVAFEVFLRRRKYLLALAALKATQMLSPSDPSIHYQTLALRHAINQIPSDSPLPKQVSQVLESQFNPTISPSENLKNRNAAFLKEHSDSPSHVRATVRTRHVLDREKSREDNVRDLTQSMQSKSASLDDARLGLDLLKEWHLDNTLVEEYRAAARKRWPQATVFAA